MKALYRKYRPAKLSEVVGQDQVVKPLENALKSGKVSHAYLFIGPRGCGKTSVARIFAHEINKFDYQLEDSYTDIIEIDAASNTGVDNIRELREKATVAPSSGKFKIYIIDEVHMLSKSAFNALLKTLEEPPRHVIFIMATTDAYKVPATIISRAQVFNFNLATPDVMKAHLEKIAKAEDISIDSDALDLVIERGGGSFRDSISLLDQISTLGDTKITRDLVINTLGLPDSKITDSLLSAYQTGDIASINSALKTALNSGVKPETLAESLIKKIMENPNPATLSLLAKLPEVAYPFPEAKLLLAFLGNTATTPVVSVPASATKSQISPTKNPAPSQKDSVSPPPVAAPDPAPASTATTLNWEKYLDSVRSSNPIVASTLGRTKHKFENGKLYLLCTKSYDQKILQSPRNFDILTTSAQGVTVEITEDENLFKKDSKVSKMSAIMGGEVQEVGSNGIPEF